MGFIFPIDSTFSSFLWIFPWRWKGRMAALGCSAGGMLALRLLKAGLDLVAAVSPAPLDQRGWEEAEKMQKISEISWVLKACNSLPAVQLINSRKPLRMMKKIPAPSKGAN